MPAPIRKDSFLVGRRLWALCRDRERWRLTNIAHVTDTYWPRGVYEADCVNWRDHSDRGPSPHPSCSCGLYAFWSMEELGRQFSGHIGLPSGIVWAWGRVMPGEQGFLAQYMMPVGLDWPRCNGGQDEHTLSAGADVQDETVCWNDAIWSYVTPRWTEPYPTEGDEDWEVGYEWCNLRTDHVRWYCAEHRKVQPQTNDRNRFWVPTQTIYTDLERFYEAEVLPPYDFPVSRDVEQTKPEHP